MNSEISCKITNTKKAQNIITVSYQNKKNYPLYCLDLKKI